jgi:hypothetical protein
MRQGRGEMNEREDEALERVKRMKEAMVGRDGDPAHHDKRRPIHDKLMDRLKKIKKLLRERGDDNRGDDNRGDDNRRDDEIVMEREDKGYDRYWDELVANNPGKEDALLSLTPSIHLLIHSFVCLFIASIP